MKLSRVITPLGGALLVATLTACSGDAPAPSTTPAATPTTEPTASSSATSGLDEAGAPTSSSAPAVALRWDQAEQERVVDLAEQTMRLFSRPTVSAETWWQDLRPLLSEQAQHDYAYVDPRNVPVSEVTGKASLVRLDSERLAIAHVPTDAGLYAVTLSRSPQAPAWVVEKITPPEPDPHGPDEDPAHEGAGTDESQEGQG